MDLPLPSFLGLMSGHLCVLLSLLSLEAEDCLMSSLLGKVTGTNPAAAEEVFDL